MQTWALKPHPGHRGRVPFGIEVTAGWLEESMTRNSDEVLEVHFRLRGDLSMVLLPESVTSSRQDELWKHTCFELFLMKPGGAYLEFNFSPSTQWAAYRFAAYREGMSVQQLDAPPLVQVRRAPDSFELVAAVGLGRLLSDEATADLRLALTAVTEDREGGQLYWALAHPTGKPDFHHRDGFVASLPVMSAG